MSATVADFLNTGRLDLFVANDAMESYFLRNLGKGKFASDGLTFGLAFGEGGQGVSSMGPVFGDVDRDGRLDLYIPDMGYGCLHVNRGEFFEDQTNASGLALICGQYTGWGTVLQDFDNDGELDLFVANGDAHHEYGEGAVMAHNNGKGRGSWTWPDGQVPTSPRNSLAGAPPGLTSTTTATSTCWSSISTTPRGCSETTEETR